MRVRYLLYALVAAGAVEVTGVSAGAPRWAIWLCSVQTFVLAWLLLAVGGAVVAHLLRREPDE